MCECTPTAGVVALGPGAVHEVLLAQRRQNAGLLEELALGGARGAERPARAARALIQPWQAFKQRQTAREHALRERPGRKSAKETTYPPAHRREPSAAESP